MKPSQKAAAQEEKRKNGVPEESESLPAADQEAKTEFLPKKDLLRVDEVAEYFNIDDRTVRRWVTHGILEGEKIRGVLNVSRQSIVNCRFKSPLRVS